MSKRQFVKIAAIVATIENLDERKRIAKEFADMCAQENSAFQRNRFYAACGVPNA